MEDLVKAVFTRMSNVKKPQKKFMLTLFSVLILFQGRATFLNMERYSCASEKRYRRWSRRNFDFVQFNTELFIQAFLGNRECVAAIDASFIGKSGHKTEGLGSYYNGSAGESQRGPEISMISITYLKSNTAYAFDAQQTIDEEDRSRVELYADHAVKLAPTILSLGIKHIAADAYYSKVKFVSPVIQAGLHIVGKLRVDADLKWLYEEKYKGSGRPRKYDGKIDFVSELDRFDYVGILDDKTEVNMHVNASLTALNLLKIEDKKAKKTDEATVISIASWKRRKFNQHLMCRLFKELELDLRCEKVAQIYQRCSDYGAIAA